MISLFYKSLFHKNLTAVSAKITLYMGLIEGPITNYHQISFLTLS